MEEQNTKNLLAVCHDRTEYRDTMSDGLISAKSRIVDGSNFIQISAPISHGSSGGVLLNEKGETIGITSAVIDGGQNLNFAIPINLLKPLLTQDIDKTLPQLFPDSTNSNDIVLEIPSDKVYEEIQSYLESKYSTVTINNQTIKYNITVSPFKDNYEGTYEGSALINFTPTFDTYKIEENIIIDNTFEYLYWFVGMANDIQDNFGQYEINGGLWNSLIGKYILLFDNWSGEMFVYHP